MRNVKWLVAASLLVAAGGCVETNGYPATGYGGYSSGYGYPSGGYYNAPSYYQPQVVTQTRYVAVPVSSPRARSTWGSRDDDHDGIPNRYDRDRNNDGVPDRVQRR